ncbi:metal ABC transporter permease [Brackiella oedipodis]|uniref:metal ABC transporter permease n=1 Tax=Brackiella oedipodis TaxID=124225 RepID=UPI00048A6425|nr:metal ABC transporter permease [Brackiella oedipodis]
MAHLYDIFVSPFVEFAFMRRALFAALFVSLVSAPIGVFLMLRRMSLVADSMSHAILPGIAIGFLWASGSMLAMLIGGLVSGLVVALAAGLVSQHTNLKEDSSFAGFYLISLGLGVLLISLGGTNLDLSHILFGSVLAVSDSNLLLIMVISSISVLLLSVIYRALVIDCFDPAFLRAENGRQSLVHIVFLLLMVVNVVTGFQVLGTLMVVGMMLLPAISARFMGRTLGRQLVIAGLSGMFCAYLGLVFSYSFDVPASAVIILLNGVFYVYAILFGRWGGLLRQSQS